MLPDSIQRGVPFKKNFVNKIFGKILDKGDLILHQKDVLGNLDMNGQIIVRDGNIMTESLGNETDNGLFL